MDAPTPLLHQAPEESDIELDVGIRNRVDFPHPDVSDTARNHIPLGDHASNSETYDPRRGSSSHRVAGDDGSNEEVFLGHFIPDHQIPPSASPISRKPEIHINNSDGLQLPPEKLKGFSSISYCTLHAVNIIVLGTLAGLGWGCYELYWTLQHSNDSVDHDCSIQEIQPVAKAFYIDFWVAQKLSFAQAKTIDVAWDFVVGQGGRLLHGWLLYQIVGTSMTWMLEYSSVPYGLQVHLLFSTVSVEAAWSSLGLLWRRQPVRAYFMATWSFIAIVYTLLFPTLWSAATGYLSPSVPAYRMPGGSLATTDTDDLTICWMMDDDRLEGIVPSIVVGPPFGAVFATLSELDQAPRNMWEGYDRFPTDKLDGRGTDDFRNLLAYARTKQSVRSFLSASSIADSNYWVSETAYWNDWKYSTRSSGAFFSHILPLGNYSYGPFQTIIGFQFSGAGQQGHNLSGYDIYNETFKLQESMVASSRVVPYNSTLWINNTAIPFSAPFLKFSRSCSWFSTTLDLCICHQDTPLLQDWRTDDNLACLNEDGYIWGFSVILVFVGLVLEGCWIIGCFGMWLDATINSQLVNSNRPGTGTIRNIIDIGSSLSRDLGAATGAYSNGELKKALKTCPPVGYAVEERDGFEHISLVAIPSGSRRRKKLKLDFNNRYG